MLILHFCLYLHIPVMKRLFLEKRKICFISSNECTRLPEEYRPTRDQAHEYYTAEYAK